MAAAARVTLPAVRQLIRHALREDIGRGDLTSQAVLAPRQQLRAVILAKQSGIVAGAQIAAWTFQLLNCRIRCRIIRRDGQAVRAGQTILELRGPGRSILAAERTAQNILGHLCGVATQTQQFVRRVRPLRTAILDTRKTLPGLRLLEKYAVKVGGGVNHRLRLDDAVLIKSTHVDVAGICIGHLLTAAKRSARSTTVEIEVRNMRELREALAARPDIVLLDNWTVPAVRRAVALRNAAGRRPLLEVSGGVTLQNVRRVAATGVERISIGRLTHSAAALDVALRVS